MLKTLRNLRKQSRKSAKIRRSVCVSVYIYVGLMSFQIMNIACLSAKQLVLTEPFSIVATDNPVDEPVIISPYMLLSASVIAQKKQPQYTLYDIDYADIRRQLSIYKTIYFSGQLLHGGIMIKMKPKFVD